MNQAISRTEINGICFISPSAYGYFNPDVKTSAGGAQRQLSFISQYLTDRFDVHFVVGDYGQPKREVIEDVTLHRSYDPDRDANISTRVVQLFNAMRQADSDIYIYRGHPKNAAVIYTLVTALRRDFVYNLANDPNIREQPEQMSFPLRWLFYRSLRDARVVIAQTEHQQKRLREVHGVDARIVPNGYPPTENINSIDTREYFLWIGRRDPDQKRPHLYLDLATELPTERFILISPENNTTDYTEQIVTRAESIENVEYLGEVGTERVLEYYRNAKAYVSTAAYEGFPNTFLESWRVNTPVLSLDVDPSRYVGNADLPGCAHGNFEEFTALARRFAQDASFRRAAAEPAKQYFEKNLIMGSVACRYGLALAGCSCNYKSDLS